MKNTLDGGTGAGLTAALILAVALFSAPAASAKTTTSSNWSGYAVHRPGVAFRQASGTWIQPNASCLAGQPGYSAVWVGIGGFKATSDALEQIGTEVDCIELTPGARQFIVASQRGDIAGSAIPSTLRRAGSRFDVTYSAVAIPPRKFAGTRQSRLRAGYLEH